MADRRPRALDLFCGAGGATRGLQLAGFNVTGVDLVRSPRYVGDAFIEGDALDVPLDGYDFIWASPVCKRYCVFARNLGTSDRHPDQVADIRARLRSTPAAWVIENVPGAPLRVDLELCGTSFGLKLLRHRIFEASFAVGLAPVCRHRGDEIPVYGNGTPKWHRDRLGRGVGIAEKRAAMGIDWMNRGELSQAIPPAYSEWIARRWLEQREERAS